MQENTTGLPQGTSSVKIGNTEVRVIKKGEGKPLFFLHGWGCSAETMLSLAATAEAEHACYFFDFPGFGKTAAPPKAWGVGDYARFTMQLIHHISPEEPVSIVAHSFGGRVMLKLLSDKQTASTFRKVLITGGAGMKPKRSWKYYYRVTLAKLLKAPFALLPTAMREHGLAALRKTAVWKSLGSSDYAQLDGVMREVFVKTVREYLDDTLPYITHDVLLLWGELDDAAPLCQAQRMEKGIKNAALVTIASAGHYAFLDQPSRFKAIMKAYLEG